MKQEIHGTLFLFLILQGKKFRNKLFLMPQEPLGQCLTFLNNLVLCQVNLRLQPATWSGHWQIKRFLLQMNLLVRPTAILQNWADRGFMPMDAACAVMTWHRWV